MVVAALLSFEPAMAQDNTCRWAFDSECDEPKVGTGACITGSDSWDCRAQGTPQPNDCFWAYDGECDEPKVGTGVCSAGSDSWDCHQEGSPRPNDCYWAYDGECDEPGIGTGYCPASADSWDCRGDGEPPGPDSCPYAIDGECDEPGGTALCLAGTDTSDCRSSGITAAHNDCEWSYDGECDEPGIGTGVCAPKTDSADCRGEFGGVLFGIDDREFVDTTRYPWSAIGKVVFESGGHCTASVVGPRLLLTAAHCLFVSADSNEIDRPTEFQAGLNGHDRAAVANVVAHHIAPGYDNQLSSTSPTIDGLDWAFLVLDRDIGQTVGMLDVRLVELAELNEAMRGQWLAISQAGYSSDSDTRMSAHIGCRIVEIFDDNTIFHECDTLQGDSGSPLFVEDNGRFRIIAIESATYPNYAGPYPGFNMAVDSRGFYRMFQRLTGGKPN